VRRKPPVTSEPVVDKRILDSATSGMALDKLNRLSKCVVCSSACPPNSTDGLCWVCRRLKISAWRDSDQQAAAQE
jgi:epoxyqueuosine reductase QueG